MLSIEKPEKTRYFKVVYEGGHHVVGCDGKMHITLGGDYFGTAPLAADLTAFSVSFLKECKCKVYQNLAD